MWSRAANGNAWLRASIVAMILVTGATGFVGRHVVREFVSRGRAVRALVRSEPKAAVLPEQGVETVLGDVLDPGTLSDGLRGVEAIVHLVAVVREKPGRSFQEVNLQGTQNLLAAAETAGVSRIVHASTVGASSDASQNYLYSRWMAEQEVARSSLKHTIVRFSVGFGEGDEFFNVFAAQVKLFPLVPVVGDGRALFEPIAVEDAARCLVTALESDDYVGRVLEAGGPERFSYDQMLDLVAQHIGARIVKLHLPAALMSPAAAVLETLTPRPPVTREQIKMLRVDNVTEADSVSREFGFEPASLRDGIGYVTRLSLLDALKIHMGIMPLRVRDH